MASSFSGCWKYDVFLSFRGEDTRKTFVGHLYTALEQRGILTYKDDVTLDRGVTIGPTLLSAIQESQIFVIVFSENYAHSSWCLDELLHIMKCKDCERGQIVIPIFYQVDPSDVRKQKRKYGEAFVKHELLENNKNKVELWRKALVDASNVARWEPKHVANGHEAKCIQEIVDSIADKLSSLDPIVDDESLVGMRTRLQDLKSRLRIGSGGVRMVGIWGLGGSGKTTLATSLYMELKISGQFHGCCFVENIREESKQHNGLKSLQERILSSVFDKKVQVESVNIGKHTIKGTLCRRNVLIVLDDVDHLEQLEALAGCHNWFGDGSRIIITTRNEQVLISHKVDEVYPVSLLSDDEAIRLFKRHAYHENIPVEDYEKLSLHVISYVNGLPLALKILGAFLYGKDKDEWISTLARLKDHPEMDIVEKLKISYDGLKPVEKELFLDISCFCRRMEKDEAIVMLDACGFHPRIGVKVLIQKALISVTKDGRFDMHDLVQEMGHYIVRGEHPNNPEKHSRLWREEDIKDLLSRNATTENNKIEAINFYDDDGSSGILKHVSNMKKLRFLRVTCSYNINYYEGPRFLSNELRYIYIQGYPSSLFPESFQPRKLGVLKMNESLQKELWRGYKYLPCLKELQLVDASELARTPDFGGLPCLEKLILKGCESLEEIHPSLGNYSSLVYLSVSYCCKLRRFPSIIRMEKLEILRISCCKALVEFPKIEAKMDSLIELSLRGVGIEILPSSVGEYCTNLISLQLSNCENLKSIEGNFHALKCLEKLDFRIPPLGFLDNSSSIKQRILSHLSRSLRKLNLGWCGFQDGEIPTEIVELSNLQELHLDGNDFTRLADFTLSRLARLKLLGLSYCKNLVELPELPSSLAILNANYCSSLEAIIRDEIHTNRKWLSQVSIRGGSKNIIGGERLLETMLQGNAIESGCMILQLKGLEIARGFEPHLVKGRRCRMQLPENWYNDFSGFLFYTVINDDSFPLITLKHEKLEEGGSMGMGGSQHYVFWEKEEDETDDENTAWVGYISFGLLRNTSWWDPTSAAIEMEMEVYPIDAPNQCISECGYKLVPKRGAAESTDATTSEISLLDDHYKSNIHIQHDSKSELQCRLW